MYISGHTRDWMMRQVLYRRKKKSVFYASAKQSSMRFLKMMILGSMSFTSDSIMSFWHGNISVWGCWMKVWRVLKNPWTDGLRTIVCRKNTFIKIFLSITGRMIGTVLESEMERIWSFIESVSMMTRCMILCARKTVFARHIKS